MNRKSFAYNIEHSKISLLPVDNMQSKVIPKAMAEVNFKAAYFEFGGEQHKPYMVFEGEIESYRILKKNLSEDFFAGVKKVTFAADNRPKAIFNYNFSDEQIGTLAKAGWFENGSETPPEFVGSRFELITENVQVDYLNPDRQKGEAPVLKVGPSEKQIYTFDSNDYADLADYIVKNIRQKNNALGVVTQDEYDAQLAEKAEEIMKIHMENAIKTPVIPTPMQIESEEIAKKAIQEAKESRMESDEFRAYGMDIYLSEKAAENSENIIDKNTAKPVTKTSDGSKLNSFLSQYKDENSSEKAGKSKSWGDLFAKKDDKKIEGDERGTGIDDRVEQGVAALKSDTSSGESNNDKVSKADEAKLKNEKERLKNRSNDAAEMVQSALTLEKKKVEGDERGTGVDDRTEQGVAALKAVNAVPNNERKAGRFAGAAEDLEKLRQQNEQRNKAAAERSME